MQNLMKKVFVKAFVLVFVLSIIYFSVALSLKQNVATLAEAKKITTDKIPDSYSNIDIAFKTNTKLTDQSQFILSSLTLLTDETPDLTFSLNLDNYTYPVRVQLSKTDTLSSIKKNLLLQINAYKDTVIPNKAQYINSILDQDLNGQYVADLNSFLAQIEEYVNIGQNDLTLLDTQSNNLDYIELTNYTIDIKNNPKLSNYITLESQKFTAKKVDNKIVGNFDPIQKLKKSKKAVLKSYMVDTTKTKNLRIEKTIKPSSPASGTGDMVDIYVTKNLKISDIVTLQDKNIGTLNKQSQDESDASQITITVISSPTDYKQKMDYSKAKIEKDRSDALEYNKKVKQYYTPEEQKAIDSYNAANNIGVVNTLLKSSEVDAKGLNNSATNLLIYSYGGGNTFVIDSPTGNVASGTQMSRGNRTGSATQKFSFFGNNTISPTSDQTKCLDIRNGNISYGSAIQTYNCNGTTSQQFFFNGVYLKVLANQNFCVTANVTAGSGLYLNQCGNDITQQWVAGSNDFVTKRYATIYANQTNYLSLTSPGHVFVSLDNEYNGTTNTFSAWPTQDYQTSNIGRYNNMGDGDNVQVDYLNNSGDSSSTDWNLAYQYWASAASPLPANWKARVVLISKVISDIYRYNAAYRYPNELNIFTYSYIPPPANRTNLSVNCVSYSTRLWTFIMEDIGAPNNIAIVSYPDLVYVKL